MTQSKGTALKEQSVTENVTDSDIDLKLLKEEFKLAHNDIAYYAPQVLVPVPRFGPDLSVPGVVENKRAMVQSLFRLQLLRVEAAKLMARFVRLPEGTSIAATEDYFLQHTIQFLAEGNDLLRNQLTSMFAPAVEA